MAKLLYRILFTIRYFYKAIIFQKNILTQHSELSHVNVNQRSALLILVPTAIPRRKQRDQVRGTWMKECNLLPFCACIFLTGRSTDETQNHAIRAEAEKHRDIIQSDIIDHYNNLTLKTMYLIQ